MAKPLVSIGPGGQMTTGLFNSVNKHAVPLWADGKNVVFSGSDVRKIPGWLELVDFGDDILALHQAFVEGERRAYGATADGVFVWRNDLLEQIGALTSAANPQLEVWGSFLLVTDQVTVPKVWRNTGNSLNDLPVPFEWAKLLKRKDVFVLAINTSNGGAMIEWCAASNIDMWEPLPSNNAGNYTVRDLDGDIIAVQDLGDNLAFYSSDNMVLGRYVGRPYVFAFKKALNGIGALGRGSVVSYGAFNFGLSQQGIFQTDGSQLRFLDDPAAREFLQEKIDLTKGHTVTSYFHDAIGYCIWHFEDVDGIRQGIGYNPSNGTLAPIDLELEQSIEREVFSSPLASIGSKLIELGPGWNAGENDPIESWIRTKPLDAGAPELFKLWDGLRSQLRDGSTGTIKVGICETPESEVTWIYDGDMAHVVPFQYESPFVVLEYRSEELDQFFKLSGLIIDGQAGGPV